MSDAGSDQTISACADEPKMLRSGRVLRNSTNTAVDAAVQSSNQSERVLQGKNSWVDPDLGALVDSDDDDDFSWNSDTDTDTDDDYDDDDLSWNSDTDNDDDDDDEYSLEDEQDDGVEKDGTPPAAAAASTTPAFADDSDDFGSDDDDDDDDEYSLEDEQNDGVEKDGTPPAAAAAASTTPAFADDSKGTAATTITYKKKQFRLLEARRCDLHETLENLEKKTHFADALAKAKTEDERNTLHCLMDLLRTFVRYLHSQNGSWEWRPSSMKEDGPGVYLIVYPSGKIKIGMSFHCKTRVRRQGARRAAQMFTLHEIHEIVPSELVEKIISLNLPALAFHPDRKTIKQKTIKIQLCELYLACSRECATNKVAERLMQMPTADVRAAVAPSKFARADIKFFRNIPDGGIFCVLTWITLKSQLQQMAKNLNSILPYRLRPEPPEGGFAKLNRLLNLFGPKLGSWEDAVPVSPRALQLDSVIEELRLLLDGTNHMDEALKEAVRNALAPIQGENSDSYVQPTPEVLATGARTVLEKVFQTLPLDHVIYVERCTIEALEKVDPDWLRDNINMAQARDILHDDPRALCRVWARSGHRVVVSLSYFIAVAEQVSVKQRFNSVRGYLTFLDLLHASGNVTAEQVYQQRNMMRSFLMGLKEGDGGQRAARILAFPKGHFQGHQCNIVSIAKPLGLGYDDTLYMRELLGKAIFGQVLTAHGIQSPSPLEPTWKCPGAPAAGGYPAQPCTASEGSLQAIMVGGSEKLSDHPLYGTFCCQRCHRSIERRELGILKERSSKDQISAKEQQRLQILQDRVDAKRMSTRQLRQAAIDAVGPQVFKTKQRVSSREWQQNQAKLHEEDSVAYQQYLENAKAKEKKRLAEGGKAKATGVFRALHVGTKKQWLYPKWFMDKLTEATRIYIRLFGEEFIYTNHIIDLFDTLLLKEKDNMPGEEIPIAANGKPKYYDDAYKAARATLLTQSNGKKWKVIDYNAKESKKQKLSGVTHDELVRRVIQEMYPE